MHDYGSVSDAPAPLGKYVDGLNNTRRRHSGFYRQTPDED
jgi:hypothetical protein